MHNQSIAVYSNNISDNIKLIDDIKKFFKAQDFTDFTIFTDELGDHIPDNSVLTTFYMIGHHGLIVFLSYDSYLPYKDNLLAKPMLFISPNDFSLDRNHIKGCDILTYNDKHSLQWIKNNEIQRTI